MHEIKRNHTSLCLIRQFNKNLKIYYTSSIFKHKKEIEMMEKNDSFILILERFDEFTQVATKYNQSNNDINKNNKIKQQKTKDKQ